MVNLQMATRANSKKSDGDKEEEMETEPEPGTAEEMRLKRAALLKLKDSIGTKRAWLTQYACAETYPREGPNKTWEGESWL